MIGLRTLVLNANYMPVSIFPLHTIPVEDAITRIFNGNMHAVYNYNRKIGHPTLDMNWPSVVARNRGTRIKERVRFARDTVYYRDHGMCQYCETPLELQQTTYDHVIPRSKGGEHTWENVVMSCKSCNNAKGNRMPRDTFVPKQRPYRPTYWQLLANRRKFPITVDHPSWVDFFGEWEAEIYVR